MGGWCRAVPALAQNLTARELAGRLGCYTWHGEGPDCRAPALEGVGARLPRPEILVPKTIIPSPPWGRGAG